jgi:hypothetical protein
MSLPADARHRWGLDAGGGVAYVDLGDLLVIVPGSVDGLWGALLAGVSDADWERARGGFGDPDLANE